MIDFLWDVVLPIFITSVGGVVCWEVVDMALELRRDS